MHSPTTPTAPHTHRMPSSFGFPAAFDPGLPPMIILARTAAVCLPGVCCSTDFSHAYAVLCRTLPRCHLHLPYELRGHLHLRIFCARSRRYRLSHPVHGCVHVGSGGPHHHLLPPPHHANRIHRKQTRVPAREHRLPFAGPGTCTAYATPLYLLLLDTTLRAAPHPTPRTTATRAHLHTTFFTLPAHVTFTRCGYTPISGSVAAATLPLYVAGTAYFTVQFTFSVLLRLPR